MAGKQGTWENAPLVSQAAQRLVSVTEGLKCDLGKLRHAQQSCSIPVASENTPWLLRH